MPVFWPYLISCLYLSRMQKYAFFPVCANIPGEILLPSAFFNFSARGGVPAFLQTKRGDGGKQLEQLRPYRSNTFYNKKEALA